MKMRGDYRPRPLDRSILAILATLHVASGLYLSSPFYLEVTDEGKSPLMTLFNSSIAVIIYGVILVLDGLALYFSAFAKHTLRFYTTITSNALLVGFLVRLYSFIGVAAALNSWRPPNYLSHLATVFILGAYWVSVRLNGRTIQ